MSKVKLAFVTSNLLGGGAQKAMVALASLLAELGHEVHLILLEDRCVYPVPPGVRFAALTPKGGKLRTSWLGRRILAVVLNRLVSRLGHKQPFNAIISTLPFCDEVCHLARLPNLWFRIANNLRSEIDRATAKKAHRLAARYTKIYTNANLICVSQGVADDLGTLLRGKFMHLECLYNPLDIAQIRALAAQPVDKLPERPYIVHAARFTPQKRHDVLLRAFESVTVGVKLVLLCDPCAPLTQLIENCSRRADVIVAGFQINPYPWLENASLSVLCSDYEGLPNVLTESLACGTPVVSTDCPSGPREILGREAPDCLVPMGDPEALAERINATLASAKPPSVDLTRFSKEQAVRQLLRIANPKEAE